MILSHGNAYVEAGFSVNKDILVENLHQRSLVAQRMVFHSIKRSGGVLNIDINPELLRHCRSARTRYSSYLEEETAKQKTKKKTDDEKKLLAQKIKQEQTKRKYLLEELNSQDEKIEMLRIGSKLQRRS